jgi:DNA-binding beta-propeller fold protein YncE
VISDGEAATNVLGQANLTTCSATTCDASTTYAPLGLAFDSGNNRLYVADYLHNRVLVFDVAVISDGEAATNVLGQANLTTCSVTTCDASTTYAPYGLAFDSGNNRLYVADYSHNRVLVFDFGGGAVLVNEPIDVIFRGNTRIRGPAKIKTAR